MCLAIPGRVLSVDGTTARVDFHGVVREIDVSLVPDVSEGDYVLVHAGHAIEEVETEDALEIDLILGEMSGLLEDDDL
jgi:hydrogenase expression/formation protein HypC